MTQTIFVVFSAPFQELTFIRNGLLEELINKHGHRCVIIVPSELAAIRIQPYFKRLAEEIVVYENHKEKVLDRITGRILSHKYEQYTGPYRKERITTARRKKPWINKIITRITAIFSKFVPEAIILFIQNHFLSEHLMDGLFRKYQPELTMVSWGGAYEPCPTAIRSARKFGCRTISMDASWDCMDEVMVIPKVDRLLVWNEGMKQEAITKHRYKSDQISVIGLLRCDYYQQPKYMVSREVFLNEQKLDQNRKIVTVAINRGDPQIYINIVNALLEADKNNLLSQPIQICLRLAPWSITENYDRLRVHPYVKVQSSFNFRSEVMVQSQKIKDTVNLLQHTDILISVLSTLILESIFSDTPNISLRFPEFKQLYERDFLDPLFETGGVTYADDIPSLVEAVNRYLLNPQQDGDGRRNILNSLCHGETGLASEKAIDEILRLLSVSG